MFDTIARGAAWDALVLVHGMSSITRTIVGGSTSTIEGIFQENVVVAGYVSDGEQEVSRATLTVHPADVTGVTLEDTFTIDGDIWAAVGFGATQPLLEIQLERRETIAVAGAHQRIQR